MKGQSEVSRYTENASPKDTAQSPTDTFRKEKKKKKKNLVIDNERKIQIEFGLESVYIYRTM